MKRSLVASFVLIAVLHATAFAGPDPDPAPPAPDETAEVAQPPKEVEQAKVPTVEVAPPEEPAPAPSKKRKRYAMGTLAGIYAAFSVWTYFAWYSVPRHSLTLDGDPSDGKFGRWLTDESYAGGADKLGHGWSTYALARLGTEMLHQWGGYDKRTSAIISAAMSEGLFLAVEFVDGYHYTFSTGDLVFNTMGAGLALATSLYPRFDDLVDFRVEYVPSKAYRIRAGDGDVNYAEDYSGQAYFLAFHPGGIPRLRDEKWTTWTRFVDVVAGLETDGYKPDPPYEVTPDMPDYDMQQSMYLGLSLNLQGVFDYLLEGRAEGVRKATHGAFELVQLPYTSFPVLDRTVVPDDPNHLN